MSYLVCMGSVVQGEKNDVGNDPKSGTKSHCPKPSRILEIFLIMLIIGFLYKGYSLRVSQKKNNIPKEVLQANIQL